MGRLLVGRLVHSAGFEQGSHRRFRASNTRSEPAGDMQP
jgi:hypothetical protein